MPPAKKTTATKAAATKAATTKTTAKRAAGTDDAAGNFTADERAAMKDRAAEVRAARRAGKSADKAREDADAVVAKIAEFSPADRALAERVHEIVTAAAPDLAPRLWYGMPAYAKDGKVLCYFQPSEKFTSRYSTFGFNDEAQLDDGSMWPTSYALTKLTQADEKAIAELVKRATS